MAILCVNFIDKFFLDIAEALLDKGMNVSHVISQRPFNEQLKGRTIVLDVEDFSYPSRILKLENAEKGNSLSAEMLKAHMDTQAVFLSISDRCCYIPQSVRKRQRLYRHLLLFWTTFLRENNIDTVIFDATPHMGWDNVLYSVAKKQGILTVWISRTLLQDRVFISSDYEEFDKVPADYLAGISDEEISGMVQPELIEQCYQDSSWLERSKLINQRMLRSRRSFGEKLSQASFSRLIGALCVRLNPVKRYKSFKRLFTTRFYSPTFLNEITSEALISLFRIINARSMKKLSRYYESRAVEADFDKKYIYFALHFQPERSTAPEGGSFEDQFLAINILSKAAPKDWVIYVKEHPRQFDPQRINVSLFRDREFYEELLRLGNVKLINLHVDNALLVNNAAAIATITGSAAWEGLTMGIPAICFGVPWYIACNSCFKVSSLEECRSVIVKLAGMDKSQVRADFLKFLAFFQNKLIISSNSYEFAMRSQWPYEQLLETACDAIIKKVNGL